MAKVPKPTDSVQALVDGWERQRPDLAPWPLEIFGRLQRISAQLLRSSEALIAPLDLTWEAFSLIVTLRRSGPPFELRPTDILRDSLLSSGAVTNRIDKVERLGLVERVPDAGDRRSLVVRLTPKGRLVADEAIARQFGGLAEILSALADDEREQLIRLLAKLLGALEQRDQVKTKA
ncbi:MarR family winged helix-turn-helix transcriptional regulator [Phreatobacter stygius]|uniref:MarR family winged helix-turn-helix transcriptional regulator n=1 Tax=Phreatobacter stygius TaxID=1940610 RepID=UPI001476BF16|nr:MarR family transcriptional regulator [Phreatobacter stygius]